MKIFEYVVPDKGTDHLNSLSRSLDVAILAQVPAEGCLAQAAHGVTLCAGERDPH